MDNVYLVQEKLLEVGFYRSTEEEREIAYTQFSGDSEQVEKATLMVLMNNQSPVLIKAGYFAKLMELKAKWPEEKEQMSFADAVHSLGVYCTPRVIYSMLEDAINSSEMFIENFLKDISG